MNETPKPGSINEDGKMWHEEWGWVEPDFWEGYNTFVDEDGKYSCWMVYIGYWNVEIPYRDDLALREKHGDDRQAYYKDLHENWKRV
jgi:hypothetical protein